MPIQMQKDEAFSSLCTCVDWLHNQLRPCTGVLFLSWLLLGAKFRLGHLVGAAICIAAIVLLIVTDKEYSDGGRAKNVILGDALVLLGASLYAVSNIAQEKLLGRISCLHHCF